MSNVASAASSLPQHPAYTSFDRWSIFPPTYDPRLQPYPGSVHPLSYSPYPINTHKLLNPPAGVTTHNSMFNQNPMTSSTLSAALNHEEINANSTTIHNTTAGHSNGGSVNGMHNMDIGLLCHQRKWNFRCETQELICVCHGIRSALRHLQCLRWSI